MGGEASTCSLPSCSIRMNHSVLGSPSGVEKPARWSARGCAAPHRWHGAPAGRWAAGKSQTALDVRTHRSPVRLPANGWSLAPSTRAVAATSGCSCSQVAHLRGPVPVHQRGARDMGQCRVGASSAAGWRAWSGCQSHLSQPARTGQFGGEVEDRDGAKNHGEVGRRLFTQR